MSIAQRSHRILLAGLLLSCVFLAGAQCGTTVPTVIIDTPVHGSFTNGTLVTVQGRLVKPDAFETLTVNGISLPVAANFSLDVPVDPGLIFNRILAAATQKNTGLVRRDVATVVVGDGVNSGYVLDTENATRSVALRIADSGFDQITPIVEAMSTDSLDISDLIAGQNPIAQGSFSGISYTANVVEVGFGGFGIDADPTASGIDATITIDDFFLEIDLDLGFLGSCTLEIETTSTDIDGSYDLAPLPADPSFADVNLISAVTVSLGGFSSSFVSGICNDPLIGDIIGLILGEGEIQQLMQDGFEQNLADPDGAGPLDSPLAGAIQDALAGISIAGPIGEALNGVVEAPIDSITEEPTGITLAANTAMYSTTPHPDAPDLPASYTVADTFPTFGPTAPSGAPYGMAFGVSNTAMNQLIKTQIANGLLQEDITEFLGLPLVTGLLIFIPEFLTLFPPQTPAVIRLRPTLAPIFTGNPGPNGEFAELKIAALGLEIVLTDTELVILSLEIDMDAGLDLEFTPTGMAFTLATPAGPAIDVTVVDNPFAVDEAGLVFALQQLFPIFAAEFEDAIEEFPIPAFLGMELDPVEVARMPGGYIGLFADLTVAPTTTIQNVVFTDLSSGDFQQSGGCWLREWRHRVSGSHLGNTVKANLKGMLGADAGCTTNDASSVATASYRVNFDVVAVPGEQWSLDIDHSILGALDRISDGYNDGFGFQDGGGHARFNGSVSGSYAIDGGSASNFDFTPSVTTINDGVGGCSCDQDVPFSGANGVTINGTASASVEVVFAFDLDTHSNSNTAFPTANGDEMAIRLGKNDTIDNNFTAGGYPGAGSRNIADDGHKAVIQLTTSQAP